MGEQNEQNTIATATRLGAANASAEIGIVNNNVRPIRVSKVDMTGGTNINITIFLSDSNLTEIQKQTILSGVQQSIESSGYTVQNAGKNLTITTSRHNYLIKLN
ncbi:MAG: class III signal peptide-containing protein [Methanobacteriaceae archaeon]|nr:class III signal peptide-containing protein [Methanobacteriaceae archaeon]